MTRHITRIAPQTFLCSGLVLVYFVLYPQDLSALLAPVDEVASVLTRILGITTSVSPWLFVVASVCALCWTAIHITERVIERNRSSS